MKFCLISQPNSPNAQSPIHVIEQTSDREVGWINRYLDREYVRRLADQPTKSFGMPAGYSLPWNSPQWILRWMPDGKTVTYALWKGLGSPTNLWSQSVAGGPPRQITNFPDEVIAYDWSPDGKQLAYTRYASIRDVVLISNFR